MKSIFWTAGIALLKERIVDLLPFLVMMVIIVGGYFLVRKSEEEKTQHKQEIIILNAERDSLINLQDSCIRVLDKMENNGLDGK